MTATSLRSSFPRRLLLHETLEVHCAGIAAIDVAGIVVADAFERAEDLRLRDVGSDRSVLGAADADALLEAGVQLIARLRVGDIEHVVLVDGDAARPAELLPLGDELAVLA